MLCKIAWEARKYIDDMDEKAIGDYSKLRESLEILKNWWDTREAERVLNGPTERKTTSLDELMKELEKDI